ncbi:MazG nucleotide pyrophosphohydrolase domain protein [uncultured archaeon]|nr:MazG nucleotide pyrophosphohydrolase domain protein [uncultured archaeon]
MHLDEYQNNAKKTAAYPEIYKIYYPALGLSAEVGEINNKIKKRMRDNKEVDKEEAIGELGDVLWYVSQLATDLDLSLEEIASRNLEKLRSRAERGKIQGSGDNR